MTTPHHEAGTKCPLCDWKLTTAHPDLAAWFWRIKERYQNAHISWAYRNAEEQKHFFDEGRTRVLWPNSKHNHTDDNGAPQSLALDLFLIDDDGLARFPGLWYAKLNAENESNRDPIDWGGRWKHFGDLDHFQLRT